MGFFFNNDQIPEMPEEDMEWKKMVFRAVFNHIPHKIGFVDTKINFLYLLLAVIIAFLAILCTKVG